MLHSTVISIPDVVLYSQLYSHLKCIRGKSYVPKTTVTHIKLYYKESGIYNGTHRYLSKGIPLLLRTLVPVVIECLVYLLKGDTPIIKDTSPSRN